MGAQRPGRSGHMLGCMVRMTLLALALLAGGCTHHRAARTQMGAAPPLDGQGAARLVEATVAILSDGGQLRCTGSIAARGDLIVSAAHCFGRAAKLDSESLVRLSTGEELRARIVDIDHDTDVAVLQMPAMGELRPLPVADSDPVDTGEELLFLGRPGPDRQVFQAKVEKRAPCPDLAAVPRAVFATHDGKPGDSGAPLLSSDGIIAIVHGGTRCEIAIPSAHIGAALWRAFARAGELAGNLLLVPHMRPAIEGRSESVNAALDHVAAGRFGPARWSLLDAFDAGEPTAIWLTGLIALAEGKKAAARRHFVRYLEEHPGGSDAATAWILLMGLQR